MTEYQQEQLTSLKMVCDHLSNLDKDERSGLYHLVSDYVGFRNDVNAFLRRYFSGICTETCYKSRLSACCSREGIITFFADIVVNALVSHPDDLQRLQGVLQGNTRGSKCVYLGEHGCLWSLKPLVCEMFLCKKAEDAVFGHDVQVNDRWLELKKRERAYRWPDRPVLFDVLEQQFIDAGYTSPLMYLHNSPGLLRVKRFSKV